MDLGMAPLAPKVRGIPIRSATFSSPISPKFYSRLEEAQGISTYPKAYLFPKSSSDNELGVLGFGFQGSMKVAQRAMILHTLGSR